MRINVDDLRWQSDWNGYEVGYPDIDVIGLYHNVALGVDLFVNVETGVVVEVMTSDDDL